MSTVTLANGKTFSCLPEQTILEAAQVQGVALEHSCRTGRCGACKARVLEGATKVIQVEESLRDDDRSAGLILTCCRTVETNTALDIEDLGEICDNAIRTLPCRIDGLSRLTEDIIEVTLRTPPANRLTYLAGQHIDVIAKEGMRRSYSIANAPRVDGRLTLHIRKVPNGQMSRYWFEQAKINDLLRLEGPLGTFCLRPSHVSQLLLLATGTGIAPIRAMIDYIAANPMVNTYDQIHLYWGGRTQQDIYWVPDYPSLPLRFVPTLSRTPQHAGAKGYVQEIVLADGIELTDATVYACGSERMIASARTKLTAAGLNPRYFHADAFVSSS